MKHIAQDFLGRDSQTQGRNIRAMATWKSPYSLIKSKGNQVAERFDTPFVKQIIDDGIRGLGQDDFFIFTNNDTCLVKEAHQILEMTSDNKFSHRLDIGRKYDRQLTCQMANGVGKKVHEGADLFMMKVSWWKKQDFPPMLLGFEGWDWILKILMGRQAITPSIVYHEAHGIPYWQSNRLTSEGNKHNRRVAREWLKNRNFDFDLAEYWPESVKILKGSV